MIAIIETTKEAFILIGVGAATIAAGVAIWFSASWCAGAIGRIIVRKPAKSAPFLHIDDDNGAQLKARKWPGFNNPPLQFGYTNYRGEFGIRRVQMPHVYWGSTDWHPEPGWLMRAWDVDKELWRDFAVADMIIMEKDGGHKMERCKRMIEELYRNTGVPRSTVRGSLVRIREFIDEAIEGIDQEV